MGNSDPNGTDPTCSFCGKKRDKDRLVEGPGVAICDGCVDLCGEVVTDRRRQVAGFRADALPRPHDIRAFLDTYVVGQDRAKMALSVALYSHYKRVRLNTSGQRTTDVELTKSNILLLGPTGSGKTLLAQSLARNLDVPFTVADATTLTEAGYIGEDVDSILTRLVQAAGNDIRKAETGIVYIDEIDKIASSSGKAGGSRDVSGEGVQQALLKMLEGTVVTLAQNARSATAASGRGYAGREPTRIDTSNILFVVGGAFAGLEDIVAARVGRNNLGFGGAIRSRADDAEIDYFAQVMPEDLIAFGMIPEFIGRLPIITSVQKLDQATLVKVLTEPRNALSKQYRLMFELDDVELEFAPGALEAVADQAIRRGTGARGLRAILEQALITTMYDVPSLTDVTRVVVTEEVILQGAEPTLVRDPARDGAAAGR
ncbi:ATP-dependent Clp protease ATP-binding subunit ClpX [Micromonospora cathayae]|uniref:ATP-dependent Clp protease ATP-binding subunit ClpX n=1 Tax=Micromonospora cathayae TaxID=3028804 RepID=A0ABY7ZTX6_9ACTN|nr:ATP-dependent Clp protease ATP-binding subunit ClpX [Micromonospora sp. HUAS 3]WDZ85856.1 ATP-dependent Clp protease ATP-binding subunit ClpX [Micromonospora sp. HUAS 3]